MKELYDASSESCAEAKKWNLWYGASGDYGTVSLRDDEEKLFVLPGPIKNVLDVGCGEGYYVRGWASRGVCSVGADISAVAVRRALDMTPPGLGDFCRWHELDWQTVDIEGMGWQKKFDLVYSAMGPDMQTGKNLKKFISAAGKYCRLVLFKDGENDIIEKIKQYLPEPVFAYEVSHADEFLLRAISGLGYSPELEYVYFSTGWRREKAWWLEYLHSIYYPGLAYERILWALGQIGSANAIDSITNARYAVITWNV